ncbi:MAG: PAS domain S-box protein [Deltaproteobacteria bacterium]|nr:PAS domain S-box protein [Deltaproteobacteria bacterium]
MRPTTYFKLFLIFILFSIPAQAVSGVSPIIRVGIFPLEPLNFLDKDKQAQGLYPDIIRKIGREEGWTVQFKPCFWSQCLAMLQDGRIDLMTTIAYSDERAKRMDFSREPVVNIWGQIFIRPGEKINNILDLAGKRVAVMRRDINGENFQKIAKKFGIRYKLIEMTTHSRIFKAVQDGKVDAGVAPQSFGMSHAGEYNLVGSSIIFSPFSTYFAVRKGLHHKLLRRIDAYLKGWKRDKDSFYYHRLDFWMGGEKYEKKIIPVWLLDSFYAGIFITLVLLILNRTLKVQVRKKTRALQKSENKYRHLVESANSVVLRWDIAGRIVFINTYGLKLFGYSEDELLGKHVVGTIVSETASSGRDLKAMIDDILHDPDKYILNENENTCRDGKHLFIQWTNRAITDDMGELREILSIGTDITARKEAEKKIIREKLFSDAMINCFPGLFFVYEDGERLVRWNKQSEEILGLTSYELYGRNALSWFKEEDREMVAAKTKEVFARGPVSMMIDIVFKGKLNPFYLSASTLQSDGHKYLVGVGIDLSEQKKLEGELLQAQKMEAVGTLAGGIAHDFNNILTAIFGFAELVKLDKNKPELVEEYIAEVLNSAERARSLVQQILTFSRKNAQEKSPLQVSAVIKEALKMLRASIPATIDLKYNLASDRTMMADPGQIHQIVMNLCTNAYHAMRETGGTLTVNLSEVEIGEAGLPGIDLTPGQYLLLEVSDTGKGFTREVGLKIFEPYYTTKKEGEGTGLGLAVVHGIVKNHSGAIDVESTPGRGTSFRVYLPVSEMAPALPGRAGAAEPIGGIEKIMFVDDEEAITKINKNILTRYGYEVSAFNNGVQALQEFKRQPEYFDLVITDMTMPYMTGLQLAQQLLNINPRLPVILCTGHSDLVNRQQAMASGISAYMEKPTLAQDMLRKIRGLFDNRES